MPTKYWVCDYCGSSHKDRESAVRCETYCRRFTKCGIKLPIIDGAWEGGTVESVLSSFGEPLNALDGTMLLVAEYEWGGYEGDAFVLFSKNGKLYEVNASHCSCYGLGGQWKPEETTKEALIHRINEGESYGAFNEIQDRLKIMLEHLPND